jgi:sarcosine oxidase subunit gamma
MIPKERVSMADALPRREPVRAGPATFPAVTVSLAPPLHRWSLRARDPKQIEALLGFDLPREIGTTKGDVACLGPDEWLWRGSDATPRAMGTDMPLSIVDVSERSVGFIVEGADARAVLNAGCPLDLERFAVGRATRTIFEGVEIIIWRESETRWSVDVWRSFAEWFHLSLTSAAAYP